MHGSNQHACTSPAVTASRKLSENIFNEEPKENKATLFFSFSKGWSCQEFTGRERPERNPGGEQIADSSILQTQTASVEHFEGVQTWPHFDLCFPKARTWKLILHLDLRDITACATFKPWKRMEADLRLNWESEADNLTSGSQSSQATCCPVTQHYIY